MWFELVRAVANELRRRRGLQPLRDDEPIGAVESYNAVCEIAAASQVDGAYRKWLAANEPDSVLLLKRGSE